MSTALILLILILAMVLLWLDSARARELGCSVVDELCRRRGYQLLDETVALSRIGLVRTAGGIRFKRLFRFEYSVEGVGRQQGYILLHGSEVAVFNLQEPASSGVADREDEANASGSDKKGDDNVIPFRNRH